MRFTSVRSSNRSRFLWTASFHSSSSIVPFNLCHLQTWEGALHFTIHVTDENIYKYWFQYTPLRDTICYWFALGHWDIVCNTLNGTIQIISFLRVLHSQFRGKNFLWDHVSGLTEVQVNGVTSSSLLQGCCHSTVEGHDYSGIICPWWNHLGSF